MPTKQKRDSVNLPSDIAECIEVYAQHKGLTRANAMLELIIAGLLADGVQFPQLKAEFDKHQVSFSNDYDPASAQDGDYTFKRHVLSHYAPRWGGARAKPSPLITNKTCPFCDAHVDYLDEVQVEGELGRHYECQECHYVSTLAPDGKLV